MGQFFHRLKQGVPWHCTSEDIAAHPGWLLLVSALLAFSGIALVLLHAEQRRYTSDLLRHGTTLMQVLRQATGHYIATGHTDGLQHLLQGIQARNLVYCTIVDANNRLVAQVGTPPPDRPLQSPISRRVLEGQELTITTVPEPASGQTIWHFFSPVLPPESSGGALRFGIIAESKRLMFRRLTPPLALIALVISLLVAVVYYFLRVLLRPMRQLNAQLGASMAVSGQPVEIPQRPAIGAFMQRWRQVMTQMQTAMEAIKEANFALELTTKVLGYEKRRLEITDAVVRKIRAPRVYGV